MAIWHAMLGILLDGPTHTFDLASKLEEYLGGGHYNNGPVYQKMKWLEDRDYIREIPSELEAGHENRLWVVTPRGKDVFYAWLREPLFLPRQARNDVLAKLFFLGRDDLGKLRKKLEALQRNILRRVARAKKRVPGSASPVTAGKNEALLAELRAMNFVFRESAELEWIAYCLDRLSEIVPEAAEEGASTASGSEPPAEAARGRTPR